MVIFERRKLKPPTQQFSSIISHHVFQAHLQARTLDSSRPLAIYLAQDLPELVDLNSINRAVPALPTGMEEETEKHLQDILVAQGQGQVGNTMMIPTPESTSVIPTPGCSTTTLSPTTTYHKVYTTEWKQPRQYIHVQPFGPSQDLPDYDMDEEDIKFFQEEWRDRRKLEVSNLTFEAGEKLCSECCLFKRSIIHDFKLRAH